MVVEVATVLGLQQKMGSQDKQVPEDVQQTNLRPRCPLLPLYIIDKFYRVLFSVHCLYSRVSYSLELKDKTPISPL